MSVPGGVSRLPQHKQLAAGVPITDKETETLKAEAMSPPWGREIRIKVRERHRCWGTGSWGTFG